MAIIDYFEYKEDSCELKLNGWRRIYDFKKNFLGWSHVVQNPLRLFSFEEAINLQFILFNYLMDKDWQYGRSGGLEEEVLALTNKALGENIYSSIISAHSAQLEYDNKNKRV